MIIPQCHHPVKPDDPADVGWVECNETHPTCWAGIQVGWNPGSRSRITWNLPERILDFEVLSYDGITKKES